MYELVGTLLFLLVYVWDGGTNADIVFFMYVFEFFWMCVCLTAGMPSFLHACTYNGMGSLVLVRMCMKRQKCPCFCMFVRIVVGALLSLRVYI